MKTWICEVLIFVLATVLLVAGVPPEGRPLNDLQEEILEVTREINQAPRNPELYIKRAELQRAGCQWDAAYVDIGRAEALTNQWPMLDLARARVFLDAQWFESAEMAADRFLARVPKHVEALTLRARVRVKLRKFLAAAADYSRAIDNSSAPAPQLYLERAQALVAAGGDHLAAAVQGLDQGIRRLGPILTLQSAAIELELKQHRVEAALARIDRVLAQVPRKEAWLLRRGEILQQAGQNAEAADSFRAALKALDTLPPGRRAVPATQELEQRIRAALAVADKTQESRSAAPSP